MITKKLKDLYVNGELFADMINSLYVSFSSLGTMLDKYLYKKYRNILLLSDFDRDDIYAWLVSVSHNMDQLYQALLKNYDPLSNYDMHEAGVDGRQVTKSESNTQQNGDIVTTQTIPSKKVQHYTTTFDSTATNRLESYDTESPDGTNAADDGVAATRSRTSQVPDDQGKKGLQSTNEFKGTVTGEADGISAKGHEVSTHELKRSGNIGVTTSQQMLNSEIELRAATNFFNIFGERFIEDCTTGMYADSYGTREEYIPWL